MVLDLNSFAEKYIQHVKDRDALGIPPLPLNGTETEVVIRALSGKIPEESLLKVHDQPTTAQSLLYLLEHRVPPGVYPASMKKADFLGGILGGDTASPYID